jgi:hypothetical protein
MIKKLYYLISGIVLAQEYPNHLPHIKTKVNDLITYIQKEHKNEMKNKKLHSDLCKIFFKF